jgi:hypothetical protein
MSAAVKERTIGRRSFRVRITILLILLVVRGFGAVAGSIFHQIGARRQAQSRFNPG